MGGSTGGAGTRPHLLETVGEFAVAPLYADGFEDLSPRERALAYYLNRAALAGRDIYYDQMGRSNLEIRDLLEEILIHPVGLEASFRESLLRYLKLFWINSGNHNDRTREKFVPEFTFEDLRRAARQAAGHGAVIRLALGETLDAKIERLRPAIFDPAVEPLVTCKTPPPGRDILTGSSVNFYENVALGDLDGFTERYPLNSRLVKSGGRLVEEVYRSGRGAVPPGRYASELRRIGGFLAKAGAFAPPAQQAVLADLEEYLATGDPEAFRRYNIAWVAHEFPVDTINGFIETYKDPRGRKGAWEGLVYFTDRRRTRLQRDLAAQAQYFEDRAPWDDRYKRRGFTPPTASAITLLAAAGDGGSMPPSGINLPNEEVVRERHGNKSVSLVNVMEADTLATEASLIDEFALPEDRPLLQRLGSDVNILLTTMHEVLGHAAGKVGDDLRDDPHVRLREYYATLEEARAELVALHHVFDPKLVEIGAVTDPAMPEAACRQYVAHDLSMLRRIRHGDRLEDDHMRAVHLIVSYLAREARAVDSVRRDGKTYLRLGDLDAFRRGTATLLATIQRIKGEGDFAAARDLCERHAIRIDPALRDEVVARAEQMGIPSYVALVMPDLVPVRDASGEVVDARIVYPRDLALQMLRYSGKLPLEEAVPPDSAGARPPAG